MRSIDEIIRHVSDYQKPLVREHAQADTSNQRKLSGFRAYLQSLGPDEPIDENIQDVHLPAQDTVTSLGIDGIVKRHTINKVVPLEVRFCFRYGTTVYNQVLKAMAANPMSAIQRLHYRGWLFDVRSARLTNGSLIVECTEIINA